jgi:ubiquinone/menaquinone biosynthesis C-methylase UbiE
MNQSIQSDPIALFRSNWETYQKLLEHNYMFHHELVSASQQLIQSIDRPLSLVDLGCGDASLSQTLFKNNQILRYIACDLSQPALQLAKANLAPWSSRLELNCLDMLEQLEQLPDRSLDLVFSSYAIHHLTDQSKLALFKECFRVLNHSGWVILIDVMRNDGQSRDHYLDNYLCMVEKDWAAINSIERARITEHVRANDFPLSPSEYQSLARQAGFQKEALLDAHGFHQAWAYQRLS